ncbi:MAG: Ig-like domain-containing protein, partial [Sinobacterium sp.]
DLIVNDKVSDQITVTSADGTATGVIKVNITGTNDVPVAEDDSFSVNEGNTTALYNVIVNSGGTDTDGGDGGFLKVTHIDGNPISGDAIFTMIDGVISTATAAEISLDSTFIGINDNGILRINADGDFTYESKGFLFGSPVPTFEYTLSDGIDTDTAEVTINVNTNAPDANPDANVISLIEAFDSGTAYKATVEGDVIIGDATSDNEFSDSSLDGFGSPIVTQVEYNGVEFDTFTAGTDPELNGGSDYLPIVTSFGTLTIHDTGYYKFSTDVNMAIPGGVKSLVFKYTIQDGDPVNPDTASTDLRIDIRSPDAEGLKTPEPSAKFIELDLDETSGSIDTFSHTLGKKDFDEGLQGFIQDMQLDLSDVLAQTHSDSLDEYLDPGADSQKVAFNLDFDHETGKGAPMEQDLVLDKTGTESEEGVYVTNGLLAEGGMIISDAFAANSAPLPEIDTQDIL